MHKMHLHTFIFYLQPSLAFGATVGRLDDPKLEVRDSVSTFVATFEGLSPNLPPPTPYQGLKWEGANVNTNYGGLRVSITDIVTRQGQNFLASKLLSTFVISSPDPLKTFDIREFNAGIFLATSVPTLRPAMDGTILFSGTRPGNIPVNETFSFIAQGRELLSMDLKIGGLVLEGTVTMARFLPTRMTGLKELRITAINTPVMIEPLFHQLAVAGVDLAKLTNGVAIDNVTYDIVTHL